MKLCIAYPNKRNYSETFIENHLRYLQPALSLTGGWRAYLTADERSIFNFPGGEVIRVGLKRGLPALYDNVYSHFLKKYLQKNQPDVFLAEYGVTGTCVMKACQKAGIPLVVHFHGFDASEYATIEQFGDKYRRLFEQAARIVAVSNDMAEQLATLGAPASKIVKNPYGVNTRLFFGGAPGKAEKIVLAVGRFTGKKAPHLTIKAFKKVLEKHPDARLVMIGSGELFADCQKLLSDLQLTQAVDLLGVKTPEEIAEWQRKARVFVQHSLTNPQNGDSEGTPNTILEASATGLPIVSTRHAGIKEAVDHGVTGFLVEEGEYLQMADYISQLLDDAALAQQMGERARHKMETEYEMSSRIQALREILEQAARGKG